VYGCDAQHIGPNVTGCPKQAYWLVAPPMLSLERLTAERP
jgi:hypothetical protein